MMHPVHSHVHNKQSQNAKGPSYHRVAFFCIKYSWQSLDTQRPSYDIPNDLRLRLQEERIDPEPSQVLKEALNCSLVGGTMG